MGNFSTLTLTNARSTIGRLEIRDASPLLEFGQRGHAAYEMIEAVYSRHDHHVTGSEIFHHAYEIMPVSCAPLAFSR
jgi:hypothetical protein